MPAPDGPQFRFEDQNLPPFGGNFLPYRYANRRLAAVGDIPEPLSSHDYFAERTRFERFGTRGQRLKNPRAVVTPGAEPGTAAFADYYADPEYLRIDYLRTRPDMRGQGLGSGLVETLASRYPDARVDFGKVMNPSVWSMADRLESQGRVVSRNRDF
jgi:GNAT superfamily N-acetyltransferase